MKKSFMNYVQESNEVIGGFSEAQPTIVKTVPKKAPIVEHVIQHVPEPIIEDEVDLFESEEILEDEIVEEEVLAEDTVSENQVLLETLADMKNFLVEQQNNQDLMGRVIAEMLETIKTQNVLIQQKFDQLDEAAVTTSKMLKETSDKLESLVVRELSIPAPIVNVAVSEQKRIVKTVNRDSNGLITQITEEIQQSVVEDK